MSVNCFLVLCSTVIYNKIDNVLPGKIVESKDGNVGIVTGVNKKTINVTYTSHRSVQGPPELFKTTDIPFEQARSKRKESSIETDFGIRFIVGISKIKEKFMRL